MAAIATHFSPVPTALLRNPDISLQAKALYAIIRSFADFGKADGAYPSQETLCACMGVASVETLRRLRSELQRAGWLQWKLLKGEKGDVERTDYWCNDLPEGSPQQQGEVPLSVGGGVPSPVSSNRESVYREPDTEKSKALVAPSATGETLIEEFRRILGQQHVNGALREAKAKLVFAYWAAKWDHPLAIYDPKRKARLESRLRENADDVSELLWVVDGAKRDDWPDRPKFAGIEHLFRDRGTVERLSVLAPGGKAHQLHPMAAKHLGDSNGQH